MVFAKKSPAKLNFFGKNTFLLNISPQCLSKNIMQTLVWTALSP